MWGFVLFPDVKCLHNILNFAAWFTKSKIFTIWPSSAQRTVFGLTNTILCNTIPASLTPLQPLWSFCRWSKTFPLQDQSKYCVFSLLTIMHPTGLSLKPPMTYPLSASKDWLTSTHCFSDPSLSFLAYEKNSGIYFISGSLTGPCTPEQHEVWSTSILFTDMSPLVHN